MRTATKKLLLIQDTGPWRWRQQVHPKHIHTSTISHSRWLYSIRVIWVLFQYVIYRIIFVPICDLLCHFRSNMLSTSRNPLYRKWHTSCNPLANKYTNLGMCRSVVFVAQFTCLQFDVQNRQQCRATWNSLKQLYVARKWLYNIYANVICWMIRRKLC